MSRPELAAWFQAGQEEAAARIARVMAADLALYNPRQVADAVEHDDLEQRLAPVLRDMRDAFAARVPADIRARRDFLKEALEGMVERHSIAMIQRGLGPTPLSVRVAFRLGLAFGRVAALVMQVPRIFRGRFGWRTPVAPPPSGGRPGSGAHGGVGPPPAPTPSPPAAAALQALTAEIGAAGPTAVWVVLTHAIAAPDPARRVAAALLIGRRQVEQAVHALITTLDDPVLEVRQAACWALAATTGQPVDFDPTAAGPARRRRIAALMDWWRTWYLQRMWSQRG